METFWTQQLLMRTLYRRCLEPVCEQYRLTGLELEILLFLHHNPMYNTASHIVEIRQLSKSHVSVSLRDLEDKGYLTSAPSTQDRRLQLLSLTEKSRRVLTAGIAAQEQFRDMMLEGFSEEEKKTMWDCIARMSENLQRYNG